MSKMGISTYQSYCGAQIFDAVGLQVRVRRQIFHRHRNPHRGRRPRRDRRRDGAPPSRRLRRRADLPRRCSTSAANMPSACAARITSGRRRSVATLQHAVRGNSPDDYRAFAQDHQRADRAAADHARPVPHQGGRRGRPQAGAARRGRAGQGDRQALRHRRDVVRLDLARGAHHARHRHEPHRRQVQHRRRRRGIRPLQAAAERRFDALGDQAGGLGPLRRHRRISRQLRHDADQDGAGRQARRRRPVARPQGRQDHRQGAPLDARRRPDLAAAASRHLFDRGSGAAHLRSEERQSRRRTSR